MGTKLKTGLSISAAVPGADLITAEQLRFIEALIKSAGYIGTTKKIEAVRIQKDNASQGRVNNIFYFGRFHLQGAAFASFRDAAGTTYSSIQGYTYEYVDGTLPTVYKYGPQIPYSPNMDILATSFGAILFQGSTGGAVKEFDLNSSVLFIGYKITFSNP